MEVVSSILVYLSIRTILVDLCSTVAPTYNHLGSRPDLVFLYLMYFGTVYCSFYIAVVGFISIVKVFC